MTFTRIDKPVEEDETSECAYCGVPLVAGMTNYGGKFPDYLQWQYSGKSHYKKDGGCKGHEEGQTKIEGTPKVPNSAPTNVDDIAYIKNKIDLMFAMISEQYREYQDRKNAE